MLVLSFNDSVPLYIMSIIGENIFRLQRCVKPFQIEIACAHKFLYRVPFLSPSLVHRSELSVSGLEKGKEVHTHRHASQLNTSGLTQQLQHKTKVMLSYRVLFSER